MCRVGATGGFQKVELTLSSNSPTIRQCAYSASPSHPVTSRSLECGVNVRAHTQQSMSVAHFALGSEGCEMPPCTPTIRVSPRPPFIAYYNVYLQRTSHHRSCPARMRAQSSKWSCTCARLSCMALSLVDERAAGGTRCARASRRRGRREARLEVRILHHLSKPGFTYVPFQPDSSS